MKTSLEDTVAQGLHRSLLHFLSASFGRWAEEAPAETLELLSALRAWRHELRQPLSATLAAEETTIIAHLRARLPTPLADAAWDAGAAADWAALVQLLVRIVDLRVARNQ